MINYFQILNSLHFNFKLKNTLYYIKLLLKNIRQSKDNNTSVIIRHYSNFTQIKIFDKIFP